MTTYAELADVLENIDAIERVIAATRRAGTLDKPSHDNWLGKINKLRDKALQLRAEINNSQRSLS